MVNLESIACFPPHMGIKRYVWSQYSPGDWHMPWVYETQENHSQVMEMSALTHKQHILLAVILYLINKKAPRERGLCIYPI